MNDTGAIIVGCVLVALGFLCVYSFFRPRKVIKWDPVWWLWKFRPKSPERFELMVSLNKAMALPCAILSFALGIYLVQWGATYESRMKARQEEKRRIEERDREFMEQRYKEWEGKALKDLPGHRKKTDPAAE